MTSAPNTSLSKEAGKSKEGRVANKSGGAVSEVFDLGKTIFYALLIAFVLRVALFQPFTIPSESMEPTLLKGDYIIVSKFAYGWSRHSVLFSPPIGHGRLLPIKPHRGDIVVFKLPRDGKTDYIKRMIGMPGDTIQVVHGHLQINGQPVQRQALGPAQEQAAFGGMINEMRFKETLPEGKSFTTQAYSPDGPADNTGAYVVPPNCFFMMGDNRDDSLDSRFEPGDVPPTEASCPWNRDLDRFVPSDASSLGVGFVPAEDLVGRADIILFSWRPGVSVFKPWTWFSTARWDRFFHLLG